MYTLKVTGIFDVELSDSGQSDRFYTCRVGKPNCAAPAGRALVW